MPPASAREASGSTPQNAGEHGIEGFFRAQSLPERPAHESPSQAEPNGITYPRVNDNDIKTWIDNVNMARQSEFEQDPLADIFFGIEEYLDKLECREKDLANSTVRYHCISAWDHSEPQIQRLKRYITDERSKKHACQAALAAIHADMERVQSRVAAYCWWLKSAKITETHLGILKKLSRSFVLRAGPISLSVKEPDSISKTCTQMKELETELAAVRAKGFEIRSKLEDDLAAMFEKLSALGGETESSAQVPG